MNGVQTQYIKALLTSLKEGVDVAKAIKALEKAMQRRGYSRLLPAVLRAAIRELAGSTLREGTRIILAKESDYKRYAKVSPKATIIIDDTLIGGYILEEGTIRTDNSYKRKLLDWYRAAVR